jgi:drug/metabolite transporter (DMT)-like permease
MSGPGVIPTLPATRTPPVTPDPGVTPSAPAVAAVGRRGSVLEHRLAEAASVGVMAIWAGNFVVVKSTIPILTPIGYSFVRFLIAGLVLLAVCLWREGSVGLPRRDVGKVVTLGVVGFGIYQLLWPTALATTSVGNSALVIAATPIFTALLSVAIGNDTLGRWKLVGAGTAFGGVGVVAASHGLAFGSGAAGDLLTLGAAICWAAYVSFGAGVLRRYSPLRTTVWTIMAGVVVLAPVGIWQLAHADLSGVGPAQVGAVLYSGLLAGALGNVVVFWGIKLLGPTRITNLQFLPPALAIVLAAVFLGEPILPTQVVGGAIILGGVLLARRDPPRPIRGAVEA